MAVALGIDLGTTNTVVARIDLADEKGSVVDVDVPQLIAPGEVAALPQLASTLYLPLAGELSDDDRRLPWSKPGEAPPFPAGAFAKDQGAKIPGRVIVSAKSWLSTSGVDRRAKILPWAVVDDALPRLSPVDVQTRLLEHVRHAAAADDVDVDVTITIPASFDEVARSLTLEAAAAAGFKDARLLEEPQAAFYALLHKESRRLRELLEGVRLVLVVDVGGGTSDFTLLTVDGGDGKGPPRIERIAVGEHLMLGGDNMDVTLARHVEQKLTGAVGALDAVSFAQLVLSARLAKETLLGDAAPDEFGVTLLSRGSKLLGGARTSVEKNATVRQLLLDGFFPKTKSDDVVEGRRGGLSELGLPYAREPALPRHIATFLRRHHDAAVDAGARTAFGLPIPDAVLLNGGVFRAHAIRARFAEILKGWAGSEVRTFDVVDKDLDRAVARGAAYAGLVRKGRGVRIGGGSARAYFVGLHDDAGKGKALCVAPRGLHEGERREVDRTFKVVVGQPVTFPLFSSTFTNANAGDVVDAADLEPLPSISTVLQPAREVPVHLEAHLTEVGTLELALHMSPSALQRFQLSFSTRLDGVVDAGGRAGEVPSQGPVHKRADEGKDLILSYFGPPKAGGKEVDPKRVKDLRRDLEKIFGVREQWSVGLARELAGVLLTGVSRRRRSADHERAFVQNLGFCLRPGTGASFDDWRIEQVWPLWKEGVQYVAEKPTWASWFVLWRRIAAGLDVARQNEVWAYLKPWLLQQGTGKKGTGVQPHGQDEMIRLACSLERIPAVEKAELGEFVAKKLGRGGITSFWPLGRLAARVPLAGSTHDVVDKEVAARFCERILEHDLKTADGAAFALAQIARRTGDRARDVDAAVREKVVGRLEKAGVNASWIQMVRDVVTLSADDEAAAFGEALPVGLRL
ncbi:MAG: Hsp70 family protein [Deltaproteobacteria bacterium]|nr:Hsp70 family protein [Deltaproteobacteria bacterium]